MIRQLNLPGPNTPLPSSIDILTCQLYLLPRTADVRSLTTVSAGGAWWAVVFGTIRQLNLLGEYAIAVVGRHFDLSAIPTALRARMSGRSPPFWRRRLVGGGLWNDPSAKPNGVEYAITVVGLFLDLSAIPTALGRVCSVAHHRFGGGAWWAAVFGSTCHLYLPPWVTMIYVPGASAWG